MAAEQSAHDKQLGLKMATGKQVPTGFLHLQLSLGLLQDGLDGFIGARL